MTYKKNPPEVHLDLDRMRVICLWDEPRQVVMNKNQHTMTKRRSFSLRITQGGRLNKQDYNRVADHPKLPAVLGFVEALKRNKLLPLRAPKLHTCDVCGDSSRVFPHYDAVKKRITWRCGAHRYVDQPHSGQA